METERPKHEGCRVVEAITVMWIRGGDFSGCADCQGTKQVQIDVDGLVIR